MSDEKDAEKAESKSADDDADAGRTEAEGAAEERQSDARADESDSPKGDPAPRASEARGGQGTSVAFLLVGLLVAGGAALYFRSKGDSPRATGSAADVISKLEADGRPGPAKRVKEACGAGVSCACRQATAHAALDGDLHAEALAVLAQDPACGAEIKSQGMQAEALARSGKSDDAVAKANDVLKSSAEDPFATYALAVNAVVRRDSQTALREAAAAARRGRGGAAHLVAALVYFHEKSYDAAKVELNRMLELDASDLDALYNLAVIAQMQGRYRDAREGYLKVLQQAPKHADSRYNLGVMTHSIGALDETRHNLARLKEIVPSDDARVKQLELLLAAPPPSPGGGMAPAPAVSAPPDAPGAASGAPRGASGAASGASPSTSEPLEKRR